MKGVIMASGGGGSGELFAAIGVTYPAGSILTCTNGSEILTAKPQSAVNTEWVFSIPEPKTLPETWTVTATDGTITKSQSVSITKEGQFITVELFFDYYLFKSGEGYQNGHSLTKVLGTMSLADDSSYVKSIPKSSNEPGRGYFSLVDVAKYNTLEIDYMINTKSGSADHFGLIAEGAQLPTSSGAGTYADKLTLIDASAINARRIATLPLDGRSGKYHIAWSQSCTFSIYNLRLY